MLYLGVHHSISDGIVNAIKDTARIDGNAIQVFTSPPQSLKLGKIFGESEEELYEIGKFIQKSKFPFFVHGKYLTSFTRPMGTRNTIYLDTFIKTLDLSADLHSRGVVNHFGSIKTAGSHRAAIKNTADSVVFVLKHSNPRSRVILEASSSNPDFIGGTIEDIKDIYDAVPEEYRGRVMFGLDTAHLFTKGVPLQYAGVWGNYMKKFEEVMGSGKLAVVHLNDSDRPYNSKINRHAEVGQGFIFDPAKGGSMESLKEILRWAKRTSVPLILEKHDDYAGQIALCHKVLSSKRE